MSVSAGDLLLDGETTVETVAPAGEEIAARSPLQLFWSRFRRDRVAMASAGFIILLIVVAIAAPLVTKLFGVPGPNAPDPNALDVFGSPTGPTGAHPFGVDELGRDILSRVIYGARVSLEVGIIGTAVAALIGTVIGLVSGFYRGWVDTVMMRGVDVFLAFPVLVLGLGIGAACAVRGCLSGLIQPGVPTVTLIIVIAGFTYFARIVRGQVLSLREKEFVQASRSLGASNTRIVFRDILPNLVTPLLVYASLWIPQAILYEAALSFLGVGVRPPTASWGQMISDAAPISLTGSNPAWWYMVFPGAALLLTVLAFNLVGDGLLDALNPRGQATTS